MGAFRINVPKEVEDGMLIFPNKWLADFTFCDK